MYEEFSSRIKAAMKDQKLSQKGFYELCKQHFDEGTSFSLRSLSNYTGGVSMPPEDKLKLIANVLGVDYDWLKDGAQKAAEALQEEAAKVEEAVREFEEPSAEAPSEETTLQEPVAEELDHEENTAEEPIVAEKAAADVPAEPEPLKKAKETKAVSEVVVLEFQSESFDITSIRERCRQAWLDQSGGSAESVRKLTVYVKPEDRRAYWVVNDCDNGDIEL